MNECITSRFFALLRESSQTENSTVGIETWQAAYADLVTQTLPLSNGPDPSATFRLLHALRGELLSTEAIYLSRSGKKCPCESPS